MRIDGWRGEPESDGGVKRTFPAKGLLESGRQGEIVQKGCIEEKHEKGRTKHINLTIV